MKDLNLIDTVIPKPAVGDHFVLSLDLNVDSGKLKGL